MRKRCYEAEELEAIDERVRVIVRQSRERTNESRVLKVKRTVA